MRRTEVLQGLRAMKFEEIYDRFGRGRLSLSKGSALAVTGSSDGPRRVASPIIRRRRSRATCSGALIACINRYRLI
jgi:hypothetical protein